MSEQEFIIELNKLDIIPTKKQLEQLNKYYELLEEWNNKINLTRITKKEEVYLKHFYDSLTISKVINLNDKSTLLDFGTGAGFPGIVLKIFYPNLDIVLVDSLLKRVKFLMEVINTLELKQIQAMHTRVENLSKMHFDVITTRAVANLSKLLEYTNNLIDTNTKLIPLKAHVSEEITEATENLIKYKLKITRQEEFYLPKENSYRCILVIEKGH